KVFDGKTGTEFRSFFAYDPAFQGGAFVAAGDLNGDGYADVITGAGAGGAPPGKAYSGKGQAPPRNTFALDAGLTGGAAVSASELSNDSQIDLLVSTPAAGGPQARALDGATLSPIGSFINNDAHFLGGIFVS